MQSGFDILDRLRAETTALFLDFDGTLTPIVSEPGQVRVDPRVISDLQALRTFLGGAIAIVSGRDIATLDKFLKPWKFPASGIHGYETRIKGSAIHRSTLHDKHLRTAAHRLAAFVTQHPGVLLERKSASFAIHYRARPELAETAKAEVDHAIEGLTGLRVLPGKMVFEVKAHTADKGTAIRTFMEAPPFASRTPVFIGDDVTDEAGFTTILDLGGVPIKVGPGDTQARYLLADPADVSKWLARLIGRFSSANVQGEPTA